MQSSLREDIEDLFSFLKKREPQVPFSSNKGTSHSLASISPLRITETLSNGPFQPGCLYKGSSQITVRFQEKKVALLFKSLRTVLLLVGMCKG